MEHFRFIEKNLQNFDALSEQQDSFKLYATVEDTCLEIHSSSQRQQLRHSLKINLYYKQQFLTSEQIFLCWQGINLFISMLQIHDQLTWLKLRHLWHVGLPVGMSARLIKTEMVYGFVKHLLHIRILSHHRTSSPLESTQHPCLFKSFAIANVQCEVT